LIDTDRRFLAFRDDALDAAGGATLHAGTRAGLTESTAAAESRARRLTESTSRPRRLHLWRRDRLLARPKTTRWSQPAAPHTTTTAQTATAQTAAASRSGLTGTGRLAREVHPDENRLELAVRGHRVLVFLSQESLLDQDVEVGRARTGSHLPFPQTDRARVLLAPENQLRFLLALGLMPPRGKDSRHQHGHHGEGDEESRHHVPGISPASALTV
jgi:hypothetical protein